MTGASFKGKVAAVTGGGSGIGAATVAALAAEGASVAVFDIDEAAGETVAAQHAGCHAHIVDVSDAEAVMEAFATLDQQFGGLDILVNNAGVGTANTLMDMPIEDWRRVIDIDLSGAFYCLKGALPGLRRRGGSVINIASIAGKRISYHGGVNYTAAKSGLLGLTRHAAFELAQYEIRVNAICPGPVLTPMVHRVTTEDERAKTAELMPLGRWVLPEDVADMVVFLAGPLSGMCTGASFDVDGGMLVSNGTPYAAYMAHRGQGRDAAASGGEP